MSDWQNKKETQKHVHDFNQRHATLPGNIKEARDLNKEIIDKMDKGMKDKGRGGRCEYRGSSYDGTKIDGPNEFDVLRVQKRDDVIAKSTDKTGYFKLEVKQGTEPDGKLFNGKCLSTEKVHNQFKGEVQKLINDDPYLKKQVIIRDHGPAIQLDVKTSAGNFSHSTDFVPAYEVNGKTYVAKPPKQGRQPSDPTYWKESHSLREKTDLKDKQTLRTIKAMRDQDPTLQTLNTYPYKNAVLTLNQQPGWEEKTPAKKITDTLAHIKGCTDEEFMPGYGNKKENLIEGKSKDELSSLSGRLGNLSTSEKAFTDLMKK